MGARMTRARLDLRMRGNPLFVTCKGLEEVKN